MKNTIPLFLFSLLGMGAQAEYSQNLKVQELLASETNGIGQKIMYPNFENAQVVLRKIAFPPHTTTG